MLPGYQKKSALRGFGGFGLILAAVLVIKLTKSDGTAHTFRLVTIIALFVVGWPLYLWGCMTWMKGKGWPPLLGLLGILNIPGLIVLSLLPDKHKLPDEDLGGDHSGHRIAGLLILGIFLLMLGCVVSIIHYVVTS